MTETDFDIETAHRQSYSLGLSVGLHVAVLFLMLFNFSWATNDFEKTPPAILMVDLSKVELGDKTNLPPEVKKKDSPKPVVPPKKEQPKKVEPKKEQSKPVTKTPAVKQEAPAPKAEQVKPIEKPAPKDAVKVKEPDKPKTKEKPKKVEPKKETVKKQQPKKEPPKKTSPQKKVTQPKVAPKKSVSQSSGLQSLLASVDKVRKPANPAPAASEPENSVESGLEINAGIKGGTSGSRMETLTISEKDLIANKIRECWNVNAGVEGAEEMIIEIKVKVNRDGRIQDVRVVNMKSNPVFRSMADSAVRAIHICDNKGSESPFKMLADKRPEHYSTWKEIHLRMNPVDGGVF